MTRIRYPLAAVFLGVILSAFAMSSHAAGVPNPLPVPFDLPPCDVEAVNDKANAVFPCNVILSSVTDGVEAATAAAKAAGVSVSFTFRSANAVAGIIMSASSLAALKADPNIAVIPDRKVHAFPKSPGKGNSGSGGGSSSTQTTPDGVTRIGAAPGTVAVTGSGVGVAVVDTGVDAAHADLAPLGQGCFDAFGGNCNDANGHGTHVSGIVGAKNNTIDVVGVAPDATIYAVRVLDASGSGSDATIMAGLQWVLDNAASVSPAIDVVNMSLGRAGSVDDDPPLHTLVTAVRDAGIALAVAAGNDANTEVWQNIPAAYPEVISVASTTAVDGKNSCRNFSGYISADTASYFTTDGAGVTISAPGEQKEDINRGCFIKSSGILSLKAGGGTTRMSGTSMASPHVAGVLALIAEAQGAAFDPESARSLIQTNASQIGTAPLHSPTISYTFDGVQEGVLSACGAVGGC